MRHVQRFLVALAGTQIGHAAVHATAADHLHDAAHGYIPTVAALVLPLGLLALLGLVGTEWRMRGGALRPTEIGALQIGLFAAQEGLESTIVGSSAAGLLADPVLWVGVLAQVVFVGLLIATLGLNRAVVRLRPERSGSCVAAASWIRPADHLPPILSSMLTRCSSVRGPPLLA